MTLEALTYPTPVIRYSGSALHVSCDEAYPHTVSVVEIDKHEGQVTLRQLRIDELRHFYTLPVAQDKAYTDEQEALNDIEAFCQKVGKGYIRLRVDYKTDLSSNFDQKVYDLLEHYGNEVRYNPKVIWTGESATNSNDNNKPVFEVAELQQMTNPIEFIVKTREQYPKLDFSTLREVFKEIEAEITRTKEEEAAKKK